MRAIGLDLGSKRIGVAISDISGTIATPYSVITRSRKKSIDYLEIQRIVREEEAEAVVVGLPLSMSGEHGTMARAAASETERIATVVEVPVYLHDERLTTVEADRVLMQAHLKADERRAVVDKVAAAVMLQSWLDARRESGSD